MPLVEHGVSIGNSKIFGSRVALSDHRHILVGRLEQERLTSKCLKCVKVITKY